MSQAIDDKATGSETRDIDDEASTTGSPQLQFKLAEFKCLRDEIQARLQRISRLVNVLLTGSLVYVTTIFVPIRFVGPGNQSIASLPLDNGDAPQTLEPILIIYFALIFILPFVSFAIEIMCTSEADAIKRTGIYIRDNIERKILTSGYRGWEDWLQRQDKTSRRRTSEAFAQYSRYSVILLYVVTSSIIAGLLISRVFGADMILSGLIIFAAYSTLGLGTYTFLKLRTDQELSPNFYDVLVLDIDGCLTDDRGEIPEKNIDAIRAVRQLGVWVILATGRSSYGTSEIMKRLDVDGWHVTAHGACKATLNDNRIRNVVTNELDPKAIGPIVRELTGSEVLWAAFGESEIYCTKGSETELERILRARGDIVGDDVAIQPIDDLGRWPWDSCDKVSKIWCYVDIKDVVKSRDVLDIEFAGVQSSRTTNQTIEFFSVRASKVDALEEIVGNRKERRERNSKVLMLADHDNDHAVMEWADHAVAPTNASRTIRNLDIVEKFPRVQQRGFCR